MRARLCLTIVKEDLERFKSLCDQRFSNVSREINLLIKSELKKNMGAQTCG